MIYICEINQQIMSEETKPTETQEKVLTPEELKEKRANVMEFYRQQNEVLTLQDEYERLHASIAESQTKTMMNHIRQAQMAAGPPKETPKSDGPTQTQS